VAAVLAAIAFGVGGVAHIYGTEGLECGSVVMPDFVSTSTVGNCDEALLPSRLAVMGLTVCVIGFALGAAAVSGAVGRTHTRVWDAALVVGVAGSFLLLWALLAWFIAHGLAYDGSG
jgi:hypothetical protein